VIGNDQYRTATLATPANDAGLIADALGAAGFTVTGARNLDQAALRESFREFIGPSGVSRAERGGHRLSRRLRPANVPLQAIRISDLTRPLAALAGRVKIVVVDAARQNLLRAPTGRWQATSRWSIHSLASRSRTTRHPALCRRTSKVLRRFCHRRNRDDRLRRLVA
jgi:hypothetical protein